MVIRKSTINTLLVVFVIASVLSVPGWFEVRAARRVASEFIHQSKLREVESKIIILVKLIENPFSWGGGKPIFIAARKEINGHYLVLYSELFDDVPIQNKALVSADCLGRNLRVVTQQVYEKHMSESGYGLLGEKLPAWNLANYDAMASVLLSQKSVSAGDSIFFSIACKWDSYPLPGEKTAS